jgi:hypothetical protein
LSICVGESPAPEFKALVLIFTKEQYSGFRLGRPLDKSLPEENSVLGTEPGTPGLDWVGLWIRAFQKKTVCWGQNQALRFRLGRPLDKSLPEENSVLGTEPGTPGLDWVGLWIRAFQKKTVCWGQNFWQAQDRDSISAGPSVKATQLGP